MIDNLRYIAVIFLSFFVIAIVLGAFNASEKVGVVAFAVWACFVMVCAFRYTYNVRRVQYDHERKRWR